MSIINHTLFKEASVLKKTKAFFTHVTGGDYYQIEFSIRAIAKRSPKGAMLQISFTDQYQKKVRIKELEPFDKLNEFNFVKTIPVVSPIVRSTFTFQAPENADKIRIQLQVNGENSFNLKNFTLKTVAPTSLGVGYFYNNLFPILVTEYESAPDDFLKTKLAEADDLPAAVYRALFDIYFAKEEFEQAAFWGVKAHNQTDSFYQATELLAYSFEQAGNYNQARNYWLKALERGLPSADRNCRRLSITIDQSEMNFSNNAPLSLASNPLNGCSKYHSFDISEFHYYELKITLPFSEERVSSRSYYVQYSFYDAKGEELEQTYSRQLKKAKANITENPDSNRTNRSGRVLSPEKSCSVSVFLKEKGLGRIPIVFEDPTLVDLSPGFCAAEFKQSILLGEYGAADILIDDDEPYTIYAKARILMELENTGFSLDEKINIAQFLFEKNPDLATAQFLSTYAEKEGHITLALDSKRYILEHKVNAKVSQSMARLEGQQHLLKNGLDVEAIIKDIRSRKVCPDFGKLLSDQADEKALYLLHNSLPYHSGGYATRSQGVLEGANYQECISMEAVSRYGYPMDKKIEFSGEVEEVIDGITYNRLTTEKTKFSATFHHMAHDSLSEYITRYSENLLDLAIKKKATVIHAASFYLNGMAAYIVSKLLNIRSIYEVRGQFELSKLSSHPSWEGSEGIALFKKLEEQACFLNDHVFCITNALKQHMIERGIPAEKMTILPNAVHTDKFTPLEKDQATLEKLGIDEEVTVIGYIGSIVGYEGLDDLVEAVAMLKEITTKKFKVLIVGSGNYSNIVHQRHLELNLEDFFIFTGRIPYAEVHKYYSLIDICPFPRRGYEVCNIISPMKPFEAMAVEKLCIVSDCDALTEIITADETGLVFERDNVESLVTELQKAIEQPELRLRLAKAGREWVLENRDWKVVTKILSSKYKELRKY